MAAIAPPPAPDKPASPAPSAPPVSPAPPVVIRRLPDSAVVASESRASTGGGPPTNGHGHGNGHGGQSGNGNSDGHDEPDNAPRPPKKRRSIWPLLLDLGLVMMLFGLIIVGRFLIPIGAVVFVVALTGWIREARSDYSSLAD
jgi:hypothetical protein